MADHEAEVEALAEVKPSVEQRNRWIARLAFGNAGLQVIEEAFAAGARAVLASGLVTRAEAHGAEVDLPARVERAAQTYYEVHNCSPGLDWADVPQQDREWWCERLAPIVRAVLGLTPLPPKDYDS